MKWLPLILYFLALNQVKGQNLVANPSFEQINSCPTSHSQVSMCVVDWVDYSPTADYYNACAMNNGFGVPFNAAGRQTAYSGNAYVGFYTGASKEHVSGSIIPLIVGKKYEVTIFVSLANNATGTSDLGVYFYRNGHGGGQIRHSPQISYASYGSVTDSIEWTKLTGTFIADTAYSKIVIGGFGSNTIPGFNYYLLDSVIVCPYRRLEFQFQDSVFCAGDSIHIPYNLVTNPFNPGDTVKLQLSSPSGQFTNPVTIGHTLDTVSSIIHSIIPPTIIPSASYKLRLWATNTSTPPAEYSKIIKIKPQPVPTATGNGPVCKNDTIKLQGPAPVNGSTYQWSGPKNFQSLTKDSSIAFADSSNAGDYILKVTFDGCSNQDTVNILIKPIPQKPISSNNGPLCSGGTLNLSTSFSPGASYSWIGPNGYSSILVNPSRTNVNANMSGDYIVKGELNGCFNYDTTAVLIHPVTPTPTASNNSPVCAGGDIKLNASAIPNASYEWNGPGLFYSTSQNVIRSNAALVDGGTYTVTAKVNGCASAPVNTVVTVAKGPEILIYPNPGDSLCPGWSLSFAAVPKNAGGTQSFEWYRNGVSTGATGQTYNAGIPNQGDSFYVRMTAGSVCNTPINSSPIKITVLPVHTPPTISISAEPGAHVWPGLEVKFKAQTGNAGPHPGYQWRRNSQDIPNAKDSILKADYLKTGDTICCLVSSNYLCAVPRDVLSNCLVMNVDASIETQKQGRETVHLYPNPNDGNFTIESSENGMLQISNLQGQVVHKQAVVKGVNTIRLRQAKGIYILRIANEQGEPTARKIIIE